MIHYKQCLALDVNHFGATINLAIMLAHNQEIVKSQKYFKHAIKLNPKSIQAHFGLAKIYMRNTSTLKDAIKHFNFVCLNDSQNFKAHCHLGIACLLDKQFEKAAESLKKCLVICPKYYQGVLAMGNLLYEVENFDAAIKYFKQALEMDPNDIQAILGLANSYNQVDSIEALHFYQMVIKLDSKIHDVHYNIGNALFKKGMYTEAIENYKKEIDINPKKAECYYNLGNAYCRNE